MNKQNHVGSPAFWGIIGGLLLAVASIVSGCADDTSTTAPPNAGAQGVTVETTRLVEVTPTLGNASLAVTKGAITYRLDEVTLEGEDMIFWIMASNKGEDQQIPICYRYCHVVDDKGDEHQNTATISGDVRQGGGLMVTIRGGINTRFGIQFEGMAKVKAVQRLDVTDNSNQLLFDLMLQGVQIPFSAGAH